MRKPSMYLMGTLLATLATGAYLTLSLLAKDRRIFLPGETSHGHYQIELACDSYHTSFAGVEQEACVRCHGEELKLANDTHPESKFTDPRNADLLEKIDAKRCVTCHQEHAPERTDRFGVTLPRDYCSHCHATIAEDRPTHDGFAFTSCLDAGCHNFHDNTALYEEFLQKHLEEPDLLAMPRGLARDPIERSVSGVEDGDAGPLTADDEDSPGRASVSTETLGEWERSAHARAGVNCQDCHSGPDASPESGEWVDRPSLDVCGSCHEDQESGFRAGRHGMRLALELEPMRPRLARLPMRHEALDRELNCTTCHGAHAFDTRRAAVEACLECHDDEHSLAYVGSPHHELWEQESEGRLDAGSGVSCATCHLPREQISKGGKPLIEVQHNQNDNLRPNEKMLRTVCMHCHGLGFSIDSLADSELSRTNFRGRPAVKVESLDLVRRRARSL